MHESFEDLYARMRDRIEKFSRTVRLPWLTDGEVQAEMLTALWKAWDTYDPDRGASFDTHWYRVWATTRLNLIKAHFRQKRQLAAAYDPNALCELEADMTVAYHLDPIPPCPSDDDMHQQVWYLLARGWLFKEVQAVLGIGRKQFDLIIETFRTDPAYRAALA